MDKKTKFSIEAELRSIETLIERIERTLFRIRVIIDETKNINRSD